MSGVTPARRAAYEVVRRCFEHDAWADRAFAAAAERHGLEGRDRGQAQRLAYGAVQRRGTSDAIGERLAGRSVAELDAPVVAALRLGLFELLFSSSADHAAVGEAVELAKGGMRKAGARRAAGASGLVNAVLRRAAASREELLSGFDDSTAAGAALAHSIPFWLAELWWNELGEDDARALMRSVNEPPELALRVNTLRAKPAEIVAVLAEAGEPVSPPAAGPVLLRPPEALVSAGPLGPLTRELLAAGELVAQSRAAQAAVELLDPQPGDRALDLCAGPGMKTAAIAARVGETGEVVAVERDAKRASQLEELCERLDARNVRVEVADAADWKDGGGYDRVLVDPPCSDLGTLASRPDIRWHKDPATIARLAAIQGAILANGARGLGPAGALVYSTCTISRAENEDVAGGFAEGGELVVDGLGEAEPELASPHDRRFLLTRPDRHGTDGFFYARLRRAA